MRHCWRWSAWRWCLRSDLLTTSTPPPPSMEVVEVVEVVSLTASMEVVWRWLEVVEVVTRTYRR